MSRAMTIRKATRDDAPSAYAIRNAAVLGQCRGFYPDDVLRQWTGAELADWFVDAVERCCHVAVVDNVIVATGMVDLEAGRIDALFVDPAHMGSGLGKRMLLHLERCAADAGLTALQLDSTLNAAPFYRRHGFVGDTVSTYESPRGISLACVPMAKVLGAAG
jgi:GNAT superfamily N-acetyltransferase